MIRGILSVVSAATADADFFPLPCGNADAHIVTPGQNNTFCFEKPGFARILYLGVNAAPTAGKSETANIAVEGVAQGTGVVVSGASTFTPGTSELISVAAGQTIAIKETSTAGSASATFSCAVEVIY